MLMLVVEKNCSETRREDSGNLTRRSFSTPRSREKNGERGEGVCCVVLVGVGDLEINGMDCI